MSQLKQLGAMTRLNIRLQLTDPAPTLILTVIPLVLIPFMMPAFKSMLLADGYTGVTGAEQAVPSIAILFSFLAVQNIIGSFSTSVRGARGSASRPPPPRAHPS